MKKIAYYVSIALSAGCLVCYFVPAMNKYSIFNIMIEYFSYSRDIADAILIIFMLIFSLLALLFAAIKKGIPGSIFAALGAGLVMTTNVDTGLKVVFVILTILLIASQICYMVFDKKEAAEKLNPVSNQDNQQNQ